MQQKSSILLYLKRSLSSFKPISLKPCHEKNSSDDCAANGTDRMFVRRYGHPKTVGRPRRSAHRTAGARQGAQLRRHNTQGACRRETVHLGRTARRRRRLRHHAGHRGRRDLDDHHQRRKRRDFVGHRGETGFRRCLLLDAQRRLYPRQRQKTSRIGRHPRIQDRKQPLVGILRQRRDVDRLRTGPDGPESVQVCRHERGRQAGLPDAGRRNGADVRVVRAVRHRVRHRLGDDPRGRNGGNSLHADRSRRQNRHSGPR